MSVPIRVLAVNHNRILRDGLRVFIETHPELELSGSAGTPDAAVRLFSENRPDLTLMDLDFPSGAGLEAIGRIRALDPGAWIIALVTFESDKRAPEAVQAGAASVLPKDLIGQMLLPMIRLGPSNGSQPSTESGRVEGVYRSRVGAR